MMTMLKVLGSLGVALGLALALLVAFGYARMNGAGDLVLTADPHVLRPQTYCLANPLRDRGPECAAESLLTELQTSGASVLVPALDGREPGDRERILDAERRHRLLYWRLGDRRVRGEQVELTYWVGRGDAEHGPYLEEASITVRRVGPAWVVDSYSAIY